MCKEFNYKPKEVWKLNYISVLNYLAYLADKAEVEKAKRNNNK